MASWRKIRETQLPAELGPAPEEGSLSVTSPPGGFAVTGGGPSEADVARAENGAYPPEVQRLLMVFGPAQGVPSTSLVINVAMLPNAAYSTLPFPGDTPAPVRLSAASSVGTTTIGYIKGRLIDGTEVYQEGVFTGGLTFTGSTAVGYVYECGITSNSPVPTTNVLVSMQYFISGTWTTFTQFNTNVKNVVPGIQICPPGHSLTLSMLNYGVSLSGVQTMAVEHMTGYDQPAATRSPNQLNRIMSSYIRASTTERYFTEVCTITEGALALRVTSTSSTTFIYYAAEFRITPLE